MQKKKCSIWCILGVIAVVAAVIVILPKVIKIVSGKLNKMQNADWDFDIEDMDSENVKNEDAVEKEDGESIFEEE